MNIGAVCTPSCNFGGFPNGSSVCFNVSFVGRIVNTVGIDKSIIFCGGGGGASFCNCGFCSGEGFGCGTSFGNCVFCSGEDCGGGGDKSSNEFVGSKAVIGGGGGKSFKGKSSTEGKSSFLSCEVESTGGGGSGIANLLGLGLDLDLAGDLFFAGDGGSAILNVSSFCPFFVASAGSARGPSAGPCLLLMLRIRFTFLGELGSCGGEKTRAGFLSRSEYRDCLVGLCGCSSSCCGSSLPPPPPSLSPPLFSCS